MWIGGGVFLGTGDRGARARIAEIVSGAPGIVNLEGPVGAPAGVGIDAGLLGGAARAAGDPALTFELLEALGSTRLTRRGGRASF